MMPPRGVCVWGGGVSKAAREATIRGVQEMQSSLHSMQVAGDVGHGAERLWVEVDRPEHQREHAIAERIGKAARGR
jgi:hypothetical protein